MGLQVKISMFSTLLAILQAVSVNDIHSAAGIQHSTTPPAKASSRGKQAFNLMYSILSFQKKKEKGKTGASKEGKVAK